MTLNQAACAQLCNIIEITLMNEVVSFPIKPVKQAAVCKIKYKCLSPKTTRLKNYHIKLENISRKIEHSWFQMSKQCSHLKIFVECLNSWHKLKLKLTKANFGEAGYRFKVRSRSKSQSFRPQVEAKFDTDIPNSCSHDCRILTWFELPWILPCLHKYWFVYGPFFRIAIPCPSIRQSL